MIYFFIKLKHILTKYAYIYICTFFIMYIYKIKIFVALNIIANYLNLFFNLFIVITINMHFFIVSFNLHELYKLNETIKNYILILFLFNEAVFKLVFNVLNLAKAHVLNYFFYYLNRLKIFNSILKYLIIKKIVYMLFRYLYKNKEYYIFYFAYLYKKEKFLFYCKFKSKFREYDVKAYKVVSSIISTFLKAYKKILTVCKRIKIYEIAYNLYLNIINTIKVALFVFMFFFSKLKNKVKLFIMYRYKLALETFLGSSVFYFLFFFLVNIIEYLAYSIKKVIKKL